MAVPRISVVIPTLNEEDDVEDAIASVRDDAAEIVVVDGGSFDRTVEYALRAGAAVRHASGGRGAQLADGARAVTGDWLLFLHADTQLEAGWAEALYALPPSHVGGAFRFTVWSERRAYRLLEAGVGLRCAVFKLPYG